MNYRKFFSAFCVFFLCVTMLSAQVVNAGEEQVASDTIPTYPGGQKAFRKFIKRNLQYPDYCAQFGAEGVCTMVFVVEANGYISSVSAKDCKITQMNSGKTERYSDDQLKAIKKECARQMAKEGLRVIRKMKTWNPGKKNGKPVRLIHSLNLTFGINYVDDEM